MVNAEHVVQVHTFAQTTKTARSISAEKPSCPLMKTPDPPRADTDMYDSDVSLDQDVVDIDVCDASNSLSDMEGTDVDNDPQCNCGADSRGHKRNCPFNSRYCTMSSPSCNQTSFISVGAHTPPATQVKPTLKVGDSVCFHRSFFGGHHAVCRIVRDFGARYQLFCSIGHYINTSFKVELVPLNDCSISLDTYMASGPHGITT